MTTTLNGRPIGDHAHSATVGPNGPILLQDYQLVEELAHFNRERIPERVVHAKGTLVYGYFRLTHPDEIRKYCKAKIFKPDRVDKETKAAVRFSTVIGERGSCDTVRDPRGMAIRFYTEDGNWDIVGNNTPVFFIKDPMLFPSLVRSQKRHPVTGVRDIDTYWDFISGRDEAIHQLLYLYSPRGIPMSYRHMNCYGGHAFKTINEHGDQFYVKWHFQAEWVMNMPRELANAMCSKDPDFHTRSIKRDIADPEVRPLWRMSFQVMPLEMAHTEDLGFDPFDITKVWPKSRFPLFPIGVLVLNKLPKDEFMENEQIAFSPANLVHGIEPSPDRLLQGRLFAYADAQRYRLGANYYSVPVNQPIDGLRIPNIRDGVHPCQVHDEEMPNYFLSHSRGGQLLRTDPTRNREPTPFECSGEVARYAQKPTNEDDPYWQARALYAKVLKDSDRKELAHNLAFALCRTTPGIRERMYKMLCKVSTELGDEVMSRIPFEKQVWEAENLPIP